MPEEAKPKPAGPVVSSPVVGGPVVIADWDKAPSREAGGPLCECGEPVAEGQSSVCAKHIRST